MFNAKLFGTCPDISVTVTMEFWIYYATVTRRMVFGITFEYCSKKCYTLWLHLREAVNLMSEIT